MIKSRINLIKNNRKNNNKQIKKINNYLNKLRKKY